MIWPSWRSSSTSQSLESTSRQSGRTPSSSRSYRQGSLESRAACTIMERHLATLINNTFLPIYSFVSWQLIKSATHWCLWILLCGRLLTISYTPSYCPISQLCPAVKILERFILLSIVEALGTRLSQLGFKPRHSTTSAPLPISARVVSDFNQHKPPSRTIAIAVDTSKAFDTVSHRLFIEMISCSQLSHNLVRWLVAYLRVAGRRRDLTNKTTRLPTRCGQGSHRGPSSSQPSSTILFLTALSPTQTWRLMPPTSRWWFLLPASWRPSQGPTDYALYWWGGQMTSNWPLLPRNPAWHSSLPTPTSPDTTLKCESVAPLNRTPKILGVTLGTHFTFGPHARECVKRASKALNVMKALAELS